jgi:hypothetical protein
MAVVYVTIRLKGVSKIMKHLTQDNPNLRYSEYELLNCEASVRRQGEN